MPLPVQLLPDAPSLEGMNADKISEFMSSPVEIETETFYSVKNYGSSMTPFLHKPCDLGWRNRPDRHFKNGG